ncbi:hypothetical protein AKJ16_DCAP06970, partial [Drosera capensis]
EKQILRPDFQASSCPKSAPSLTGHAHLTREAAIDVGRRCRFSESNRICISSGSESTASPFLPSISLS